MEVVAQEGKELVRRTDIKDSPFQVVTTEGKTFGVMGKWRITEAEESNEENFEEVEEKVIQELERMTWNRVIQVIMILTSKTEEK